MFWNLGGYGFFDYKYNIYDSNGNPYGRQDYDGMGRWVYLIFSIVSIVLLLVFLRKTKKEKVIKFVGIVGILLLVLEVTKVSWESYWDIKTGRGFNLLGLLPLYTCSLFMYLCVIAGFSKGKVQDCCLAWIPTVGLVGGVSNLLFIQGLKWYPFFTFGAFHSMFFHYMMVFTALFVAVTRAKTFEFIDIIKGFIPHAIFSAVVIPFDFIKGYDYMQYYDAGGVPVFDDLINNGKMFNVPFLGTLVMLLIYFAFIVIFATIYKYTLNNKKKS